MRISLTQSDFRFLRTCLFVGPFARFLVGCRFEKYLNKKSSHKCQKPETTYFRRRLVFHYGGRIGVHDRIV